ncbi:MAG TPA: hypothetical protein VML55_21020 [Planctomycetaceae bacterium]|nr:hypothetical protein [Planctomycetaceae bacterium]
MAFLVGAVGFVGLGIKLWQDGNGLPFDAVAARMRQFRVWVYAAISLFGTACVILWFLPDRPDADDSQ